MLLTVGGANPLTVDHLPILMDRLTAYPPDQRRIDGLININTAPPIVLKCIPGLTGEQVGEIIEARERVEPETKATTAWLVIEEVLDLDTYIEIAPLITARGQQFTIESIGYADHMGMITRLEVVVDMMGPLAQVIDYRDVSHLGANFPISEEDKDNIRVND